MRRATRLLAVVPLIVAMDLPDQCGGPAVPDSWKEPAPEEPAPDPGACAALKAEAEKPLSQSDLWERATAMREYRQNCR